MSDPTETSFLSRWSRRKAAVREGKAVPAEPVPPPAVPASVDVEAQAPAPQAATPEAEAAPAPTLADVATLKPGDSVARFVAQGVDETVKRAALKTLFADPHFNVMDGLDIYIDDYSKPDPIPPDVLRRLRQSETLGLFDPIEPAQEAGTAIADQGAGPVEQGEAPAEAHVESQAPAESSVDHPAEAVGAPRAAAQTAPDEDTEAGAQGRTGMAPQADVRGAVPHTEPATDKPA